MADGEPCPKGCFFKASCGTVHRVERNGNYTSVDVDSYVSSGLMSAPVGYREVADFFGVSRTDVRNHPLGRLTEDAFIRMWGV